MYSDTIHFSGIYVIPCHFYSIPFQTQVKDPKPNLITGGLFDLNVFLPNLTRPLFWQNSRNRRWYRLFEKFDLNVFCQNLTFHTDTVKFAWSLNRTCTLFRFKLYSEKKQKNWFFLEGGRNCLLNAGKKYFCRDFGCRS